MAPRRAGGARRGDSKSKGVPPRALSKRLRAASKASRPAFAFDREETLRLGFPGKVVERKVKLPDGAARPWDLDTKFHVVGTKVQRLDGLAKATGRAKYASDMNLPGMLHARLLGSPIAAGTLTELDLTPADQTDGVKAVIALRKVGSRILHAGEFLAAVAAETPEAAEDGLRAIVVGFEKAEPVTTVEEAVKEGARWVFEKQPNVTKARENGAKEEEIAAELAAAAATVKATFKTQIQTHSALETHGGTAWWKKDENGETQLTVWASTQGTFSVRDDLCGRHRLEPSQVEVICEYMGGGFGAKFGADEAIAAAVELSKRTGRPVKCMNSRKDEHVNGGCRPNSVQFVEAGANADGKITCWHVKNHGTGGIEPNAGARNPMIYNVGKSRKVEFGVRTNAGAATAMRAPGHPQGSFVLEQVVDELAEKLGMDPIEFRLKNDPYPMRPAQYELAKQLIGWERRNPKGGQGPLAGTGTVKRGMGVGASTWGNNGGPGASVTIVITGGGSVEVRNGAQDIGTGTRTLLGICAAEELGCPLERVKVRLGFTRDPQGPASGGSSTAPTLAAAAKDAGHAAKRALLEKIAPALGVAASELDIAGGRVVSRGDHEKSWSWDDACRRLGMDSIEVTEKRSNNMRAGFHDQVGGVQIAEVEVDTETGIVRVVKVVAVHDAGTIVNRLTFESQILGGVIQGIAYALFEDRILDRKSGLQLNANLESYKIPGSLDMPDIVCVPFAVANGFNSAGVAGLGEPTVIPTAGAIANAIANATGARVRELPMTPDRVLAALAAKERSR